MSLYRRATRRDAAEPAIVDALVQLGAHVTRLSSPGVPDLLVSWRGSWYVAEVKTPKRYTKAVTAQPQALFRTRARAPVETLRTPEQARDWLLSHRTNPPVVERVLTAEQLAQFWDDTAEGM